MRYMYWKLTAQDRIHPPLVSLVNGSEQPMKEHKCENVNITERQNDRLALVLLLRLKYLAVMNIFQKGRNIGIAVLFTIFSFNRFLKAYYVPVFKLQRRGKKE